MRNARPSRRQVEMTAQELDFDYFADVTRTSAEPARVEAGDELAGCQDLLPEFDAVLEAAMADWGARTALLVLPGRQVTARQVEGEAA